MHGIDTVRKGERTSRAAAWIRAVPLLACVALYLLNAFAIYKYSVNAPFWDDWAMFAGDNHPAAIDLGWLRAQHNEHRIATYKFLVWLQFQINGWNYPANLFLNLAIFGVLVVYLVRVVHKNIPYVPLWAILSFAIFLLSPINWFSHFTAMQGAFHLFLLFFVIGCNCLFDDRQRWRELLIACVAIILSSYSMAGGVVTGVVMIGAFSIFKGLRIHRAAASDRRREWAQLLAVAGIAGVALASWMVGYTTPSQHPALVLPYRLQFWVYLANLISMGFGFMRVSIGPGILCLLIVIIPVCGEIWKHRHDLSRISWTAQVLVLGLLANAASTSLGRAGFGVEQAKSDRYAELVLPLILLSVCHWALLLRQQRKFRTLVLLAIWLVCAASFARKWDFGVYQTVSAGRREGRKCIVAYYRNGGADRCPTLSPFPLAGPLEQAKRLNASIYREAQTEDLAPSR